jgi:hypothetical protein
MKQGFDDLTFQIEHIISKKHHGADEAENLALACFACNNQKGPNLSGRDPRTGEITRLFHPRRDEWDAHFEWKDGWLLGRTAIGRTTIDVLGINRTHRRQLRLALIEEGVFP